MRYLGVWLMIVISLTAPPLRADDDLDRVPNERVQLKGEPKQEYFLIGPAPAANRPEGGYKLLLVLPGGDGSAEFNPFVRRIWQRAVPEGYLVAELIAVPSGRPDQVVWPTAKSTDPKQSFTTEQFIQAVVKDVGSRHPVDADRVYVLAWSSGGPAAYAATLSRTTPVRGAFVAMSVFKGDAAMARSAKGKRFYLLQSPQDQVTRYEFAERAAKALRGAGATVEQASYQGGHGWHGDVFGTILSGVEWLDRR